jgi:hypothetical protein
MSAVADRNERRSKSTSGDAGAKGQYCMIPSSDPTNGDTSPSPGPQRQPVFVAPRNRDAWSTIRGFVYQADLTIERWLHLEPEKDLQLECGEDIDTVSQYIQDGVEERLLEQVKHREENVTLKHASVLAALANAVEHRQNNPEKRLLFRFTTNAHAGKERLSPFPGNTTGISAWERLRLAELGIQPLAESIMSQSERLNGSWTESGKS